MKIFLSYETSAIILTVCLYVSVVYCSSNDDDLRSLHKRLKDKYEEDNGKKPPHHLGPPMGVLNEDCDDGVHGIEIDWDPSSSKEYTCLPTDRIENTAPAKEIHQDKDVTVYHICLDKHVHYKTPLPLSGDHRPLWAKYGEYRYIPPPRWVHNLEHGAVILLYHPCMKGSKDIENLKKIVKGCLRKHIISPYRKVPHSHPFALLTYHHGLLLSHFDVKDKSQLHRVVNFIKRYAQQSPEAGVWGNGQYSAGLRHRSHTVSDKDDSNLCPKYHRSK